MRRLALGALALLLGGCVSSASPMLSAEGEPMWAISCGGELNSMQTCFKKAAEVCPYGYRLLDTRETRGSADDPGLVTGGRSRIAYVTCEA